MIIVEGPDGSGKSTLIKQLSDRYDLQVNERVVSKDGAPMTDLKLWVERNLAQGFQYKLFDRHRLISEFVYGPVFRKEQKPEFLDLTWSSIMLQTMYNDVQPVIIYCLPPLEVVTANIIESGEKNTFVLEHIDAMYMAYVHRIALDWSNHGGRVVVWDYTRDFIVEAMTPGADPLRYFDPIMNYAKGRAEQ